MKTTSSSVIEALQAKTSIDWDQLLADILSTFDCVSGTLHQLDADAQILKLVSQRGLPEKLMSMVSNIPVGKGMAGICAERQAPVQTCNLQTDDTGVIRPGAKETKMAGAITVPIVYGGELAGTLGVAKPVAYDFTDAETADLLALAQAIGVRWARAN